MKVKNMVLPGLPATIRDALLNDNHPRQYYPQFELSFHLLTNFYRHIYQNKDDYYA